MREEFHRHVLLPPFLFSRADPAPPSFCHPLEEEDAFDNDFASTDEEEGANDDEDAGEKDLRRQEKQARKVRAHVSLSLPSLSSFAVFS